MFDDMMTDRVTIRAKDGTTYADVPASVQTGMIFTQRTDIPIQPGDQIVRRTAAGVDELFVVEDPGFHSAFHGLPATYQMRVRRADTPRRAAAGVIYNITGPNARFNVNSVDTSTNVINGAPPEIFQALQKAIASGISPAPAREDLLAASRELEAEIGKPSFVQRYAQFIALAANHMEVVGPFVPALTQLLTAATRGV